MIDHRCYAHNVRSCEIKAKKKSGLNGIKPMTSAETDSIFEVLCVQLCTCVY